MVTPVISGTIRTNLGPLTTNTCTEVIQECGDCDVGWAAQTCIDATVTDNTDCWPPRAGNVPNTSGAVLGWGIYSPGIVCPGGFTPAAGATQGGFSPIQDPNRNQTYVRFKPTTTFLVGSCGTDGPIYTPFSVGGTLGATKYDSFSVSAPFIQVVYQASDMPGESTITSSNSTNPSPTSQPNNPSPESD
ncbi:hypothetical protein F5Y07DRAFT_189547 [Xylaria sp. FL0933]|nr:hypothetical protein F5Y07DRAFT_189547 [Xylaria sp. FL0933]